MSLDKVAPLSSSFMATSMIGFFVSFYYIWKLDETWGFTLCLLFVFMFIASMISMRRGMIDGQLAPRPKK
ncbi:MAG: hypothetical protein AABX47_05475 [Nanoarchaeota archaeon]